MIDSWKSKEYSTYTPNKILIVGLTDNLTARKIFEEKLKTELKNRGIEAIESYDVFESTFTSSKQTEKDIQNEVAKLSKSGFDAILISAVKGVDEKEVYSGDTYQVDYYWRRFGRYYHRYQDVYWKKGYYSQYKVYHIEASLYNIKEDNDKSLVWTAQYNIVDPKQISTTVNDYVNAIIKSLEKEKVITFK
ncbi:hypothetical protein CW733_02895 [Lacinutrix sp. Bg11-31]|nr:hypothetical protein CW733_02895 [Lacinutrix sp. Bg11-31]